MNIVLSLVDKRNPRRTLWKCPRVLNDQNAKAESIAAHANFVFTQGKEVLVKLERKP